MRWDPEQYARYSDERGRPFHDLVARIGSPEPCRVVDLGCGPGDLTATLAQRWPGAEVIGVDSSPEMVARARALGSPVAFEVGDLAAWSTPADVLVSNAALQWVPGHDALLTRWARALPPGRWLAFQVPGNHDAPSHRAIRDLAATERWAPLLDGRVADRIAVLEPAAYAGLLLDEGLVVDAWETTYLHVLTGPDPVLEWLSGTGLRPTLAALAPEDAARFRAELAPLLREAYPPGPHGTVLPFRRIFAVAHRP